MDRKSWIIVIICAALLLLSFHFRGAESERQKQIQDAETKKALASGQTSLPAPPAPVASQNAAASSVTPVAPGVTNVLPAAPKAQKTTWELVSAMEQKGDRPAKEVARFVFSNIGGSLEYVEMSDQMVDSKFCRNHNVRLNENASAGIGALVFGVNGTSAPQFDQGIYVRSPESTPEKLVLLGKASNGLVVRKEYSLVPQKSQKGEMVSGNAYMISMKITIENPNEQAVRVSDMGVFAGMNGAVNKDEGDIYTHYFWRADDKFHQETSSHFSGGMFSAARSFALDPVANMEYAGTMGQFFVNILIPHDNAKGKTVYASPKEVFLPESSKVAKAVEVIVPMPSVELSQRGVAGASHEFDYDIFTGPKLNQMLGDMPGHLDDVMGYGWLTVLSEPMNWLLNIFHGWFGNWGWAIIGMTIVVRGVIWPLHRKSYMSMRRMSQLQPMMKEVREKYPNDPNKVNMEMMKLYQKYGINPVSGCLPMLIQIPIFFAFYRVLQSSTEMRGEPFILWVKDLARPDTVWDINLPFSIPFFGTEFPVNILPIIMAVTMIVQMRMTPQTGDKMQQRILNLMPLMFFAFCYNFASALALYWTTQNIISIGQTYLIRRLPEPKLDKKPKKAGFFQKLMEQQRAMMEQQQAQQHKNGGQGMKNITPKK